MMDVGRDDVHGRLEKESSAGNQSPLRKITEQILRIL